MKEYLELLRSLCHLVSWPRYVLALISLLFIACYKYVGTTAEAGRLIAFAVTVFLVAIAARLIWPEEPK